VAYNCIYVSLGEFITCSVTEQMKDVNNNQAEMQLKVLEILQPEIQKLKNFMAFQAGFSS